METPNEVFNRQTVSINDDLGYTIEGQANVLRFLVEYLNNGPRDVPLVSVQNLEDMADGSQPLTLDAVNALLVHKRLPKDDVGILVKATYNEEAAVSKGKHQLKLKQQPASSRNK